MSRIAVTPGCPAGIGPEVAARALLALPRGARALWCASRALLLEGARRARLTARERARLARVECALDDAADRGARVRAGVVDEDALVSQRDALVFACEAAARGDADALVTGPVRKRALVVDGVQYPGQTEIVHRFLAEDARPPLMVFAGAPFVLGLCTVHLALSDVPRAITPALVDGALARLDEAARAIGRGVGGRGRAPRIVVLGVNPHAGEGGMLGREELDVIAPAIARAVARGLDVVGPVAADGFFADVARGLTARGLAALTAPGIGHAHGHAHGHVRRRVDAVLAMHHDQGLAPYKLLAGGAGVNATWGLRVPRTSPDHGTADALAGTGEASARSMTAALALAARLATGRRPRVVRS